MNVIDDKLFRELFYEIFNNYKDFFVKNGYFNYEYNELTRSYRIYSELHLNSDEGYFFETEDEALKIKNILNCISKIINQ